VVDFSLNIVGSEWVIIIFVALVLILGTNQLPSAARKLGKAVNEYNKAKDEVQNHMKDITNHNVDVSSPVENERQKLEMIAKSLGVRVDGRTDDELRDIITGKIGQKKAGNSERESEN